MLQINHPGSFRDNSGFIFKNEGKSYRQINKVYKKHYDFLLSSGLYQSLVEKQLLVPHREIGHIAEDSDPLYKIILPEQIKFITYPYGWSFSMLKDAALLTLKIQKHALEKGMVLKDASAYNVQFVGAKPMFIDTLSFEIYDGESAWKAYGQFCRHFLAPLALMSYTDVSLNKLLISNLDGIPLELATRILPLKSKFNFSLYIHLFLHAKSQKRSQNDRNTPSEKKTQIKSPIHRITDHLISTIEDLKWKAADTVWDKYYDKWVADQYFNSKNEVVERFINQSEKHRTLLDLGANDGTFSIFAANKFGEVLSFDIDPACVEQNYLLLKRRSLQNILPLIVDFTNPEPSIGWNNTERNSLLERIGKVDMIMALAVIHHLCIGNNIPLDFLAGFFSRHCDELIIEFVPKSDEKVKMLLKHREDIFDEYTPETFRILFSKYFEIKEEIILRPTERILFFMKLKNEFN
ncbi:hypothetical protein SAMN04515674_11040 [Pseudarcicella hirudinis]|uniref:SAM-dependent methyltransferase n=1 Tax=Pseudarcicella hirudinis TaxID=1079859 RepID=A0A1I5VSS7_9BACT|nr:class I SAM-dependent methyltransferase [Pseudarcicella hirudinis]SFQ10511.1 hypothetical protein SAMN04515674_11040 [Pseudarcicella hirudinis]